MKETLKINLKVSERREKEILSESKSKVYLLRNWGYPFAYPFFLSGLLKAMADTSIGTCRPSSWSLSCGDITLPLLICSVSVCLPVGYVGACFLSTANRTGCVARMCCSRRRNPWRGIAIRYLQAPMSWGGYTRTRYSR